MCDIKNELEEMLNTLALYEPENNKGCLYFTEWFYEKHKDIIVSFAKHVNADVYVVPTRFGK